MPYNTQKSGELYDLAKRYNTTMGKTAKDNNLINPNANNAGQTLNLNGPSLTPQIKTLAANQVQPQAVQQAWNASQQNAQSGMPAYSGLSAEDYTKALVNKATAGVNSSYDTQMATISQNLSDLLSNLGAEKATDQANLDKQLESIHNNEFATTEAQKELMNQAGWNPNNSGLAVGELTKVKMGADKQSADANGALALALQDIARRMSDAQNKASNDRTSLDKWKANELAGVEADAMLQGDQRNYQQYRDSMADWANNRNFDYQKGIDDRNFNYQKGVDDRNFNYQKNIDSRNFDYQKSVDDRNYNYQVGRDQVLDDQWMKQFNSQEQQRLIENALQNKQISISEGNLALQKAAQNWSKDPNNPDNIYKQKQIEAMDKPSADDSNTIGPLYNSMMNSGDPQTWLSENSQYLTKDELSTLYGYINKSDPLADALRQMLNNK